MRRLRTLLQSLFANAHHTVTIQMQSLGRLFIAYYGEIFNKRLYKLTNQDGITKGGTQWGVNVTHALPEKENPELLEENNDNNNKT